MINPTNNNANAIPNSLPDLCVSSICFFWFIIFTTMGTLYSKRSVCASLGVDNF